MKHIRFEKEFSLKRFVGIFSFSTNLWGEMDKGRTKWHLISLTASKEVDCYMVSIAFLPVLILIGFSRGAA